MLRFVSFKLHIIVRYDVSILPIDPSVEYVDHRKESGFCISSAKRRKLNASEEELF